MESETSKGVLGPLNAEYTGGTENGWTWQPLPAQPVALAPWTAQSPWLQSEAAGLTAGWPPSQFIAFSGQSML